MRQAMAAEALMTKSAGNFFCTLSLEGATISQPPPQPAADVQTSAEAYGRAL